MSLFIIKSTKSQNTQHTCKSGVIPRQIAQEQAIWTPPEGSANFFRDLTWKDPDPAMMALTHHVSSKKRYTRRRCIALQYTHTAEGATSEMITNIMG